MAVVTPTNAGGGGNNQNLLLQKGATGAEVKQWQEYLLSLGYAISASGTFDQQTYNATRQWQRKNGLDTSGSVNTEAWQKAGLKVGQTTDFDKSAGQATPGITGEEPATQTTPEVPTTPTTEAPKTEETKPNLPPQLEDPNPNLSNANTSYSDFVNENTPTDPTANIPPQAVDPNPDIHNETSSSTTTDPTANIHHQSVDPNPNIHNESASAEPATPTTTSTTEAPAATPTSPTTTPATPATPATPSTEQTTEAPSSVESAPSTTDKQTSVMGDGGKTWSDPKPMTPVQNTYSDYVNEEPNQNEVDPNQYGGNTTDAGNGDPNASDNNPTRDGTTKAPPMTYEEFVESETAKPGTSDTTQKFDQQTTEALAGLDTKMQDGSSNHSDRTQTTPNDQTATPDVQGNTEEDYVPGTNMTWAEYNASQNNAGSGNSSYGADYVNGNTSASGNASGTTNTDPTMTESTRQAEYDALMAFASEQHSSDIAHNQAVFDKIIDALTASMNSDIALAGDIKAIMDGLSKDTYDKLVAFAEQKKQDSIAYAEANHSQTLDYLTSQLEKLVQTDEDGNVIGGFLLDQKNLLLEMSEADMEAVIAALEDRLSKDKTFAEDTYAQIESALNDILETGRQMASDIYSQDTTLAESMKANASESAKAAYENAVKEADIERERAVVDARNSYDQSLSTYGAKAEQMANMGLGAGGYSAYLDNQAYAQQRAETQAANAQAAGVKRQAGYAQSEAERQAEAEYLQRMHQAEVNRINRNYEIDTTYQTNLLGAKTDRDTALYDAQKSYDEGKASAESAHRQNQYTAESNFNQAVFDAQSKYDEGSYLANLERDEAVFNANQEYNSTMTQAELDKMASEAEANATHKQSVSDANKTFNEGKASAEVNKMNADKTADDTKRKTETQGYLDYLEGQREDAAAEATQNRQNVTDFASLLEAVNSGTYTKEQAEKIAQDLGLPQDQIDEITGAADEYATSVENAESDAENAAATEREKEFKTGVLSSVTYDTTNEALEDMKEMYDLTDEEYNRLVERRNTQITKTLDTLIRRGDFATFDDTIEDLYRNDMITKDEYQNKWIEAYSKNAEGIHDEKDLSDFLNTLEESMGTRVPYEKRSKILQDIVAKNGATAPLDAAKFENGALNINGKKYSINTTVAPDETINSLLQGAIYPNNTVVALFGEVYYKVNGGWRKVGHFYQGTKEDVISDLMTYNGGSKIPNNSTTVLENQTDYNKF